MNHFLKNLPLLICGGIIITIIYQSALVAPAINKLFSTKDASKFLRYIWPKFFIIISFLSLMSVFVMIFFSEKNTLVRNLFVASFLISIICYIMIPYMNNASDTLEKSTFQVLHIINIALTISVLVINVIIFFKWNYDSI